MVPSLAAAAHGEAVGGGRGGEAAVAHHVQGRDGGRCGELRRAWRAGGRDEGGARGRRHETNMLDAMIHLLYFRGARRQPGGLRAATAQAQSEPHHPELLVALADAVASLDSPSGCRMVGVCSVLSRITYHVPECLVHNTTSLLKFGSALAVARRVGLGRGRCSLGTTALYSTR